MSFTLSNYKKIIPTNIVKEGETTFKQGAVKKINCNKNNEWVAEITMGKDVFNVEIMIDGEKNILDHFCDCPSETEYCRHQVATFIKMIEVFPATTKKEAIAKKKEVIVKKKKLSIIDTILNEVSSNELHDFIRKITTENKVFKNHFLVHFADKNESNDRKYYSEVLRSTATSIKRNGYLGVRDTKKFLQTAQELADKATYSLSTKKIKDFTPIGLAIIETLIVLLKRMDDSEKKLSNIIKNTFSHFEICAKEAPYDIKTPIFKELFEVLEGNLQEIYHLFNVELSALWKEISKEQDLKPLYINFLDKQCANFSNKNSGYFSFSPFQEDKTLETILVDLKIAYLKSNGMESKIPTLLAKHLHVNRYQKEYIEYLFEEKNYKEAKRILEKSLLNNSYSADMGSVGVFLMNKLDEANEKLGDKEGMILAFLQRFRLGKYTQLSVLGKVKKLQTKAQWNDTFELLVKEITRKSQNEFGYYSYSRNPKIPISLGNLYAFDERWEELEKMIYKNNDIESYGAFAEYLLINNLKKTFQFFKDNLLDWLKKVNPNGYGDIAKIVAALQNAGETTQVFTDSIIQNIQVNHKGKKTLIEALRNNGVRGF